MKDANCPYCNAEVEICHDDGYGYEEDKLHQQECDRCGKTFTHTTSISFYVEMADCLNGSPHVYELSHTIPRFASKMTCAMCGEKRELTDEERKTHGVPTYEEYEKEMNAIKEAIPTTRAESMSVIERSQQDKDWYFKLRELAEAKGCLWLVVDDIESYRYAIDTGNTPEEVLDDELFYYAQDCNVGKA